MGLAGTFRKVYQERFRGRVLAGSLAFAQLFNPLPSGVQTPLPRINNNGIVNGADFTRLVAPCGIASVFGERLASKNAFFFLHRSSSCWRIFRRWASRYFQTVLCMLPVRSFSTARFATAHFSSSPMMETVFP